MFVRHIELKSLQDTHVIEISDLKTNNLELKELLKRSEHDKNQMEFEYNIMKKELQSYKASGTSQHEQFLAAKHDLKIQNQLTKETHNKKIELFHEKILNEEKKSNTFKIRLKAQKEELIALRKSGTSNRNES